MSSLVEFKHREIIGQAAGAHLLITGGVHGDEFEPMAAIRRLIRLIDPLQLRGSVTLIPVVNEPAYENCSRVVDDGLDLARVFPGKADGTITERIAYSLTRLIRRADYYVDLHTGGTTMAILPLCGYMLHADSQVLEAQRRMAKSFNLPVVWGTAALEGRSLSAARDANVPAIYAEYRGAAMCDPDGVAAYLDGCLNVMAMLDMIDRHVSQSHTEYIVEDERPGAGHLQVQNPSPCAGFFEPAVSLGQRVRVGDPIGSITDPLGEDVVEVNSRQDGLIAALRTFPRVERGNSLAVIIEVDRHSGGI